MHACEMCLSHVIRHRHVSITAAIISRVSYKITRNLNKLLKYISEPLIFFKVCKSVHHRTIQIDHQPDATILQFIILTFIYSSTCFGCLSAHHQPAGPTTNTARLSPRYEGKNQRLPLQSLSS